jgi:hypothetical protein
MPRTLQDRWRGKTEVAVYRTTLPVGLSARVQKAAVVTRDTMLPFSICQT